MNCVHPRIFIIDFGDGRDTSGKFYDHYTNITKSDNKFMIRVPNSATIQCVDCNISMSGTSFNELAEMR